jgi:hypothetical protein
MVREMGVSYYDTLPPAHEPGTELRKVLARLRLPFRVLASVQVPAGRIVVAFVTDSALLSRMFAANWAQAGIGAEPRATLYALSGPAARYGLPARWDGARWWWRDQQAMVVFGLGSYRLVKVCMRGICSAVCEDDSLFLHGCTLLAGNGDGVVITGSSGAGKTTLVAALLRQREHPVAIVNDDWGAVSLSSGCPAGTGERMLHMKRDSVLALRPGFFRTAPAGSYAPDLSEPDQAARVLVKPESVYGAAWSAGTAVVRDIVVVVREPPGWLPPARRGDVALALLDESGESLIHHHEAFFNGSLILISEDDKLREERRYRRLLNRTRLFWINNHGTPEAMAGEFVSAITRRIA